MPKLIAKERFFYAGRNIEAGQEFESEHQDVDLLTHSVSPRATVAPVTAADVPKRRYNRRDMRAKS